MLRGRRNLICCLIHVQHNKSVLTRKRTEKATVITKKENYCKPEEIHCGWAFEV